MTTGFVLDLEALSASYRWLYPVWVAVSNVLGLTQVNGIWIVALALTLGLVVSADGVLQMQSSLARQRFSPRAFAQDLLLFYVQLGIGRLVPYALIVVSSAAGIAPAAALWLREALGLEGGLAGPLVAKEGLLFLSLFLAQDFARFSAHMLQHRFEWIWELHKFHHSANSLNVFTVTREHPLVIMMNSIFVGGATIGAATTVLVACPDLMGTSIELAGGILSFVFIKTVQLLGHYHRPISFGPLDRWIVSPAVHAIHHSDRPDHHDRNFGSSLTLWDRLFGTYVPPERQVLAGLRTGIDDATRAAVAPLLPLKYLYWDLTVAGFRRLIRPAVKRGGLQSQ